MHYCDGTWGRANAAWIERRDPSQLHKGVNQLLAALDATTAWATECAASVGSAMIREHVAIDVRGGEEDRNDP
jgi:hypothetical protein